MEQLMSTNLTNPHLCPLNTCSPTSTLQLETKCTAEPVFKQTEEVITCRLVMTESTAAGMKVSALLHQTYVIYLFIIAANVSREASESL